MKRFLAATVTTAVLATGGVAVAGAAQSSGNNAAGPTSTTAKPHADTGAKGHHPRLRLVAVGIKAAAGAIHISALDLRAALQSGQTVADVAKAHHVDPKAVEDAMNTAIDKLIDTAVTNGKIDAARAATIKTRVATRVTQFVEHTPKRVAKRGGRTALVGVAAKAIGISPKDLLSALQHGQSVADVANAHHVAPQTVIDAIVKAGSKRLEAIADKFVNNTHTPGGAKAKGASANANA